MSVFLMMLFWYERNVKISEKQSTGFLITFDLNILRYGLKHSIEPNFYKQNGDTFNI